MSGDFVVPTVAGLAIAYAVYEALTYQWARSSRGTPGELDVLQWTGPITGLFYSQRRMRELMDERKARDKA